MLAEHTRQSYKHLIEGELPQFSRAVERAYAVLAKTSPSAYVRARAKELLVRTTFRYLLKEAIKHGLRSGLEVGDLVAVGKVHLWKAVDKYNPDMPNEKAPGSTIRFLSYAVWDIKHAFQSWSRDTIPIKGTGVKGLRDMVSLDTFAPAGNAGSDKESTTTRGDLLADVVHEEHMEAEAERRHCTVVVRELLGEMEPGDRELLAQYYGVGCGTGGLTTTELAKVHGVTHQAVHNRITRAMRVARQVASKRPSGR